MIRSRSKTRLVFLQIGVAAWGVLMLGAFTLFIPQAQAVFDLRALPLGPISAGLAGIGLVAFLVAGLMSKRSRAYILFFLAVILILVNGLAYFGAYTLTHFNESILP
ncbi:MAG: hypothetical protein AAGF24_09170, partial [Cyanobacteria bacterium P01_H01_bin.121]